MQNNPISDNEVYSAGKKKMYKKYSKWMNKAARAARKRKVAMWQRYKQTQSYEDLVECKLARKQVAREHREGKRSFELNLAKEMFVKSWNHS
jgi:hypothetical protein